MRLDTFRLTVVEEWCECSATAALPFEPNAAQDVTAAISQLRAELGDDGFAAAVAAA